MKKPAGARRGCTTIEKKVKEEGEKEGSWDEDCARGQFAENFKNATFRSARNEISQRILIQDRSRGIADVNARYRLFDLPSEQERFSATESRSRDPAAPLHWYSSIFDIQSQPLIYRLVFNKKFCSSDN